MSTALEGRARLLGERELLSLVSSEIERGLASGRAERGFLRLGEREAFYKGSALRGKHALRHALRRALSVSEIPRLAEFQNLVWLREQGFLAPRPLLAGVFARGGLPRFQFLLTERVPGATPLDEWLPRAAPNARAERLTALAEDLARLHALGFVHRDLFPRNLLVTEDAARVFFLDAWRGGPRRGLRGASHDLGCLFLDGASLFARSEQERFLHAYAEASARAGRELARDWIEAVVRARRRVFRRESARRTSLAPDWVPPTAT